MSEKQRRRIGVVFAALSVGICLLPPVLQGPHHRSEAYPASGREAVIPDAHLPDGIIAVNAADEDELLQLPGVGETMAAMILEERNMNGPFYYPEDLIAVKGIGVKKVAQMREYLNMDLEESGDE